jgi:sigma-B regulation protein RsbU (phosphoserine phosphatase)
MAISLKDYIKNLTEVTAEKERIGAELNVATQIQADMLPRIFPPFPEKKEFDLYATMSPAKEVGGDFYDFYLLDDDHLCMVMADVSGKGVPAALFMVIAKTLIKNRAQLGGSPSEILAYANEQLCEGNDAELFVTVWIAILEISTGKGVAANAGHENPVIKRAGGDYDFVKYKHSPPVAILEEAEFEEHEFELHPGDRLFIYTDGVPEATSAADELFGEDRMLAALNENKDETVENVLHNMKKSIDEFVGEAPQFDDITMLTLNYYGNQS